jgi:hypothetical protein
MPTKQELKNIYFNHQKSFFGAKPRVYKNPNMRDITAVFSSISDMPQYSEVRKRFRVHQAVGRVLLEHHLGYIVFATYRGDKLIIMAKNHIAQTELNYQKMNLLKYLTKIRYFENIKEVSILRWDKEMRDKKIPEFSLKKEDLIVNNPTFKEASYGIFDNTLKNEKLFKKVEIIRELIKKIKEK